MVVVRRALLSCYDKTDLHVFAKGLVELGVELIASSGTATLLRQHGVRVSTVEEFAGITEQLDGRVKTLHPRIHAGILARRDDPAHARAVGPEGLIDLVVVNLYPFHETVRHPGVSCQEALEQIDIGGVALLRAAAKNFPHVAVVSRPSQYPEVLIALRQGEGTVSEAVSRSLAATTFQLTSAYDQDIAAYVGHTTETRLPDRVAVQLRRHQALRYGENPHQHAAWYVPDEEAAWGLGTLRQLQGKELSYNNLLDLDAALRGLLDFPDPTCVIVKHHAPCGLASGSTMEDAFLRAREGDAESAFGGVVGFNRALDAATAERLTGLFLEVILAPSVEPQAAAWLSKKPNLRVVRLEWPTTLHHALEWRQVCGSWLLQAPDSSTLMENAVRVVTKRAPTDDERSDLVFAWTVAKHVQSNGIVIARHHATTGIGQGQPSRVRAVRLAIQNAGSRGRGAVAASDGFFPFPDSLELIAQAGITAVIQPGGSVKDAEVIAAADQAGVAMIFTGLRHFRH
ncbi:MAG: bifunctional phosphoribosylaminoimidazolecarboxamide formyltransferase/IMP cyclohydrolase [Candidatus Omnitrophica bacterium]|nr:bifunctional phosphoribosylaminoimidazolecarboxamide formyltransferase/IMP cyclohydrolase [Candidatus Omnitrophota bacterium]